MSGDDRELEPQIARAILGEQAAGLTQLDVDQHLALVRRAAEADRIARDLLRQSISAARGAGLSWAVLGAELGMSRQAVQQRFGAHTEGAKVPGEPDEPEAPEQRWLGPVTAFEELAELELAGSQGWHTVEAGMLRHRMVRTDTQWEHRRVLWTRPKSRYLRDGWQLGCTAFPWLYLIRDLGVAPETTD